MLENIYGFLTGPGVAAILALLMAIPVVFKATLLPLAKFIKIHIWDRMANMFVGRAELDKVNSKLDALLPMLTTVVDEVTPNGGGSMKDAVMRTERTVLKGQKIHQAVMNNSDHGIFEVDEDGDMAWANDSLLFMCGMTMDNFGNQGWVNAVHEEERGEVIRYWEAARENKRDFDITLRLHNRMNDAVTKVNFKATRLTDKSGDTMGYHGKVTPV